MKRIAVVSFLLGATLALDAFAADQVKIESGLLTAAPDSNAAVRVFRGIPYAEPPVGELRWRAPQPAKSWPGVRRADTFGPRCAQRAVFADMVFRSHGMGEDCLYLNIWTPARSGKERLPVLVYFYGGGFWAGDGSEPRYDGASELHQDREPERPRPADLAGLRRQRRLPDHAPGRGVAGRARDDTSALSVPGFARRQALRLR